MFADPRLPHYGRLVSVQQSFGGLPCGAFFFKAQVVIVDAVAVEDVIPGGGLHILAPVFVPFDVGFVAQDACALLADIGHGEEGADVEAHAVVEVRVPADGLLLQWLPAHEDVVGGFAFEDQLQLFLEGFGGGQLFLGAVHAACAMSCFWRLIQSPR